MGRDRFDQRCSLHSCIIFYWSCVCRDKNLLPGQYLSYFHTNQITCDSVKEKKSPQKDKWCENLQWSTAGGGGRGWGVAITGSDEGERESITGSCVLYERDREGFTKKEVSWKRDSHSEIEASRPLESTLRLTPSCFLPFSICRYSTSSEDSVLFVFDVILLILLLRQGVMERKIPLVCSDHTVTDGCWRGSTG